MKIIHFIAVFGVFCGAPCFANQPISVSGCAARGVEAGCIILKTVSGKTYNITAAKPTPALGHLGQVTGTLRSDGMSLCQEGEIIDPATWTETGKLCPLSK